MRRIPELDALRGLAAVAIVVHHLWFLQSVVLSTAVDLFFVMSGFLITSIILKQLDRPEFLTTFYARRALRIWPIYYLSLFGFVALNAALPEPAPLDALPYYLTYTQRVPFYWFGTEPPFTTCFAHTWTLAIEEQFYLIWPLLIFLLGRKSLVPLALAMIALAVSARMAGFPIWLLITRCDGLALGGLLAVLLEGREVRPPSRRLLWMFVLLSIGSLLYLANGSSVLHSLGWSDDRASRPIAFASLRWLAVDLLYFGLVGWIVCNSGRPLLAPLRDRRLCSLGMISYGIYLYHFIVIDLLKEHGASLGLTNRPVREGVMLALSFGLAVLSWKFIERPLLARKERFAYTRIKLPVPNLAGAAARLDPLRYDAS